MFARDGESPAGDIENLAFPSHEVLAPSGAVEEEQSYWQWIFGAAEQGECE